jgi:hypothetical protein
MPHVAITARTFETIEGSMTVSWVVGQTPPPARVAAITARSRQVTIVEHWRE